MLENIDRCMLFFSCLPHMYSPDTGLQQGPELRWGSHARSSHSLTHKGTEAAAQPPHAPPVTTLQLYLGRPDSSCRAEERQGLNTACCKAPSRSGRGPPVEARKDGRYRRRAGNRGVTADLPRTSTHRRGSPLASTWIRAGGGRQSEHSLHFNRFG